MDLQQILDDDERPVRRIEAENVVVADLGQGTEATVESLDGTAIVVFDDETVEIDLPSAISDAFITNGVLTIELEDDR
jgi:hypothetical protein